MKFSNHKTHQRSFLRKLFLSFLIITITITFLLTLILTITFLRTTIKLISHYNDKLIAQSNYSITYLDETAKKLGTALYSDKDIIGFLNMKNDDALVSILAGKVIDKHLVTLNDIDSVYIYNASLDLFYSSRSGERQPAPAFSDQVMANLLTDMNFVKEHQGRPVVEHVDKETQSTDTCSYIFLEPSSSTSGLKNAIVINIRTNALTKSIQAINRYEPIPDTSFLVVDSNGAILSTALAPGFRHDNNAIRELCLQVKNSSGHIKQFQTIDGISYLVSYSKSNANNWYVMGVTPVKIIFNDVISTSLIAVCIAVIVFVFCISVCLYLARRLNSPIQAIAKIMIGEAPEQSDALVSNTQEFQLILSVYESMKEQSLQLDRIMRETGYAAKQDFLNALLSESTIYSMETVQGKLRDLNLEYISSNPLCMCLFKIDNYSQFTAKYSQKECLALRYAVVNIATEIAEPFGTCEIFSCESDKFLMLVDCATVNQYKVLQEQLERYLREVQNQTQNYLHISLSMTYSTLFQGLGHLPSMYNNLKDSIQLKIRYGHGCIINPYMIDEINTDDFHISVKKEEQLISKVLEGDSDGAVAIYQSFNSQLYKCSYNEISTNIIHLVYSIYSGVLGKMPAIKDDQDSFLQEFLYCMHNMEIASDVDILIKAFLEKISSKVSILKNSTNSNDYLMQRIIGIVEQEYSNTGLCLSLIAEKLRMSPNYIGKLFKSSYGQSIAQYILDYRMQKLDEYMRNSQMPLSTIIEKVGLERNNYFYTRFKKYFGMSLSEYRLHLGQDADDD